MSFGRFIRVLAGLAMLMFYIYCLVCMYRVAPKILDEPVSVVEEAGEKSASPEDGRREDDTAATPAAESGEPAGTVEPVDPETVPALSTVAPAEPGTEPAPEDTAVPAETAAPADTPAPTEDTDSPAARAAARGLPAPPDIDINSWEFILANEFNPIGEYEPQDPTELEGQIMDGRIIDAMKAMVADTREQGLSVYLSSGYRSYWDQQANFNRVRANNPPDGKTWDGFWIALPPGTSEHQTGLCCDITYTYVNPKTSDALKDTPMYVYMSQHCQEFGFIVRYPDGMQAVTGVMFEPWHFRYVGVEAATYIMENGITLEDFVSLYREIGTAENPAGDWRTDN